MGSRKDAFQTTAASRTIYTPQGAAARGLVASIPPIPPSPRRRHLHWAIRQQFRQHSIACLQGTSDAQTLQNLISYVRGIDIYSCSASAKTNIGGACLSDADCGNVAGACQAACRNRTLGLCSNGTAFSSNSMRSTGLYERALQHLHEKCVEDWGTSSIPRPRSKPITSIAPMAPLSAPSPALTTPIAHPALYFVPEEGKRRLCRRQRRDAARLQNRSYQPRPTTQGSFGSVTTPDRSIDGNSDLGHGQGIVGLHSQEQSSLPEVSCSSAAEQLPSLLQRFEPVRNNYDDKTVSNGVIRRRRRRS